MRYRNLSKLEKRSPVHVRVVILADAALAAATAAT